MRILFILKKNETYGFTSYTRRSSGLYNSTRFITEALAARGVHAKIVEVIDNNDIDREVSLFKPHQVVVEALWVVPEKFDVLKPLHPNVEWYVHMHSGLPFLALEGIAMEWLIEYAKRGVGIIANSQETYDAFKVIIPDHLLTFLPNVYVPDFREAKLGDDRAVELNVGCFGAVRPMKNHLVQAMAALKFARSKGMFLRFHINASRTETGGEPVLKNLVQLFDRQMDAELVRHAWMEPADFLDLLANEIDIGMQVSLTETFNVVCADYVSAGVPVVASSEVKWLTDLCKADADSIDDIVRIMTRAWRLPLLVKYNQVLLARNSEKAQSLWYNWLKSHYEG